MTYSQKCFCFLGLHVDQDEHFRQDTQAKILKTYSENVDGEERQLLSIFKKENWKILFRFIDRFVSSIRGRLNFDHKAGTVNSMEGLVTPSDIAFALNTLDNNYDSWKQLAEAGGKAENIAAGDVVKPKYTKGKNHSVQLVEKFTAMENKVLDSLEAIDESELSKHLLAYMAEVVKDREAKKGKISKTKAKERAPRRGRKRHWNAM